MRPVATSAAMVAVVVSPAGVPAVSGSGGEAQAVRAEHEDLLRKLALNEEGVLASLLGTELVLYLRRDGGAWRTSRNARAETDVLMSRSRPNQLIAISSDTTALLTRYRPSRAWVKA